MANHLAVVRPLLGQPVVTTAVAQRRRQGRVNAPDVPAILAAYKAGATMRALGVQYSVHEATVCLLLQREGVESRGRAAVIHEHVAEVRRLRVRGWSLQRIAEHYKCSTTTVWRALRSGSTQ